MNCGSVGMRYSSETSFWCVSISAHLSGSYVILWMPRKLTLNMCFRNIFF